MYYKNFIYSAYCNHEKYEFVKMEKFHFICFHFFRSCDVTSATLSCIFSLPGEWVKELLGFSSSIIVILFFLSNIPRLYCELQYLFSRDFRERSLPTHTPFRYLSFIPADTHNVVIPREKKDRELYYYELQTTLSELLDRDIEDECENIVVFLYLALVSLIYYVGLFFLCYFLFWFSVAKKANYSKETVTYYSLLIDVS